MTTSPAAFPRDLHDLLVQIGTKLDYGRSVTEELGRALDLLSQIPASAVARADTAIATTAQLYHRGPQAAFPWLRCRIPSDKEQLLRTPGLEYLFFFHRDGRIREIALLKAAGGLPSPFLFAAVAWRLNDWAAPVREAALRCAERSFPMTDPYVIARAAPGLLTRQANWGRWSSERKIVDEAFARADVAQCLSNVLIRSVTGPMASALRHALRNPALDPHLEHIAREAAQPGVRAIALDTLIEGEARWPTGYGWQWIDKSMGLRRRVMMFDRRRIENPPARKELLDLGVSDRSSIVRRVALTGIMRHLLGTHEAREHASRLAADRSPSVRARAEFILRGQPT